MNSFLFLFCFFGMCESKFSFSGVNSQEFYRIYLANTDGETQTILNESCGGWTSYYSYITFYFSKGSFFKYIILSVGERPFPWQLRKNGGHSGCKITHELKHLESKLTHHNRFTGVCHFNSLELQIQKVLTED